MKNKWIYFSTSLIVISFACFFIWKDPNAKYDMVNLEVTQIDLQKDLDRMNVIMENIQEYADDHNITLYATDSSNEDGDTQSILQKYNDKEGVTEYFFSAVALNNVDVFLESFHIEVISKDLFNDENPNKEEVAIKLMNQISRNGTLKEIGYSEKKGVLGTVANEADVILVYDDGIEVTITLTYENSHSNHHDNHNIYVITTPASEIINSINKITE